MTANQNQYEHNRMNRLKEHVEGIEILMAQKEVIDAQIRDKKAEVRIEGFSISAVNQMLKERKMTPEDREMFLSICEIYRAELGMLFGNSLSNSARNMLSRRRNPPGEQGPQGGTAEGNMPDWAQASPLPPQGGAQGDAGTPEAPALSPEQRLENARQEGRHAGLNGADILSNPYMLPSDPCRAQWDEAWCAASGNDGMELPQNLRRTGRRRRPSQGDEGSEQ